MTEMTLDRPLPQEMSAIDAIIHTYQTWVETLAGYMKRAASLLDGLYAEQDETVEQLRELCAKTRSLRHADFDAIFGTVLADRRRARGSLSVLVDGYLAGRNGIIREVEGMLASEVGRAVELWPDLKQRLLGDEDNAVAKIVAALRQVHLEQEKVSAALSGLLMRGERLKIDDLKTVAQRLARTDSRGSAELAALLGICESAGRNAALWWERLAEQDGLNLQPHVKQREA
jgi:hypothetical protein